MIDIEISKVSEKESYFFKTRSKSGLIEAIQEIRYTQSRELKTSENSLLGEKLDAELSAKVFLWEKIYSEELNALRKSVTSQDNIEGIQHKLTLGYQAILQKMLKEAIEMIGEPPCPYAWVGAGSYGRGEVLPYSDVEYLWLFEDDSFFTRCYFDLLNELICLQIRCVNEPEGFHPDEYPEVRNIQYGDKKFTLPRTLDEIAQGLAANCKSPEGIYTQILSNLQGGYIAGDITLWESYENKVKIYHEDLYREKKIKYANISEVCREIIFVSVNDFEMTWQKEINAQNRGDAKKGYSFFITYLALILKFQFNIEGKSTLEILQGLINQCILPKDLGNKCKDAWKKVQMLRYRTQMFYEGGHHDFYDEGFSPKTMYGDEDDNKNKKNKKHYFLSVQEKSELDEIHLHVLTPIYKHLSAVKIIEKAAREVKAVTCISSLIQLIKTQSEAYQALHPALTSPRMNKPLLILQEIPIDLKPLLNSLLELNRKPQQKAEVVLNRGSGLVTNRERFRADQKIPLFMESVYSPSHLEILMKLRMDAKDFLNKKQDIKFVQEFLSAGYEKIVQSMFKEIEVILGPAPGHYCIAALGSLSRRDVSASFGLEFALIAESQDNKRLFVWLKHLRLFLQYSMENLGESEEHHLGFHLNMLRKEEVETIESYLSGLKKYEFIEDNTRLNPLYLYGDKTLFQSLQKELVLPEEELAVLLKKALNQTRKTYQMLASSQAEQKEQNLQVNVKTDYLQPIILLLAQLSYLYGFPQSNSTHPLDILTELARTERLDESFIQQCTEHLAWLYRISLQTQLNRGISSAKETDLIKREAVLGDIEKETLPLLNRYLKWVLEDRIIGRQCHPLYYPSTKGERLGFERQHQAWCDKINKDLISDKHTSKLPPIKVKIASIGEGWLNASVTQQLVDGGWINKKGEFNIAMKETSNVKGRHLVMEIKLPDRKSVYLKIYPEMPGMEYAAGSLSRLLIGRGLPSVAIARFEVGKETYPVLISETINGFHFDEVVKQKFDISFDSRLYSEIMILTLVLNPEDAKPDNFILVASENKKENNKNLCMGLVSIDNDRSFYPAVLREEEKNTILVKSMVYCFDEMNTILNSALREEILSLSPNLLLSYWLDDIGRQDEALRQLFNPKEIQELFKEQSVGALLKKSSSIKNISPESSIIPIPLREKLVAELYLKLCNIQNTLKENPQITHLELLKNIEPLLGHYYGNLLKTYAMAIQRFQEGPGKMYGKGNKDNYVTQQTLPQTLKTLQGKPLNIKDLMERKAYYAKEARNELLETHTIYHSSKSLLDAITEGKPGALEQLSKLPDELKEKIIGELDFSTVKTPIKEILNFMQNIAFKRLRLKNFIELKDIHLKKILKNSPELQELTLRNIPCADKSLWEALKKYCFLLEKLHLDNLIILSWDKKITQPILFPYLSDLSIANCPVLDQINVGGGNLSSLRLHNLSGLTHLNGINSNKTHIAHCPKLMDYEGKTIENYSVDNHIKQAQEALSQEDHPRAIKAVTQAVHQYVNEWIKIDSKETFPRTIVNSKLANADMAERLKNCDPTLQEIKLGRESEWTPQVQEALLKNPLVWNLEFISSPKLVANQLKPFLNKNSAVCKLTINELLDNKSSVYTGLDAPIKKLDSSMAKSNDPIIRIILLGMGCTNKKELTIQFVQGVFVKKYDPTIEDSYKLPIEVDGQQYILEILDTAGTESFSAMRDLYIKNGHVFILVYSIVSKSTFDEILRFHEEIVRVKNTDKIPIILVGSKCDLRDKRQVTVEQGEELAQKMHAVFIEADAKTNVNVDPLFYTAVREALKYNNIKNIFLNKRAKNWLEKNCELNRKLYEAVTQNQKQNVQQLIQQGVSLVAPCQDGSKSYKTLLDIASTQGDTDMLLVLLNQYREYGFSIKTLPLKQLKDTMVDLQIFQESAGLSNYLLSDLIWTLTLLWRNSVSKLLNFLSVSLEKIVSAIDNLSEKQKDYFAVAWNFEKGNDKVSLDIKEINDDNALRKKHTFIKTTWMGDHLEINKDPNGLDKNYYGDCNLRSAFLRACALGDLYTGEEIPTIFDNFDVQVEFDNKKYTLQLWNTSPGEDFSELRPLSHPGTDIFFMIFSIAQPSSLQNIFLKWVTEVNFHSQGHEIVLIGIGNNRRSEQQNTISYESAIDCAKKINAITYIEISDLFRDFEVKKYIKEALEKIIKYYFLGLNDFKQSSATINVAASITSHGIFKPLKSNKNQQQKSKDQTLLIKPK